MLTRMQDYKFKNFYLLCRELLEIETGVRSNIEINAVRYDVVLSEVIDYIGEKGMMLGASQEYCDSIAALIVESSIPSESESLVDPERQELAELRQMDDDTIDTVGGGDLDNLVTIFGQATSYAYRPIWPGVPNPLANLILKIMEFLDKFRHLEVGGLSSDESELSSDESELSSQQ
ncbi:uncharacterized protein LOC131952056 [Physella acuta]|uniref:uncharacterized protein LOC131952056 n=1 Tax=Physella acuta TaxID=109671 RepID=UPI0027DC3779|nr:uncharacterized protein LOC131952056 [Physella acuta]